MMCQADSKNSATNPLYANLRRWLGAASLAIWCAVGLAACNKDTGPVSPMNQPPGTFSVSVVPALNAASISWTAAVDPDGDTVSYTLVVEGDTLLVAVLGGDHSTPLGLIEALAGGPSNFGILQIDAHCDLREAYEDMARAQMAHILEETRERWPVTAATLPVRSTPASTSSVVEAASKTGWVTSAMAAR